MTVWSPCGWQGILFDELVTEDWEVIGYELWDGTEVLF